LGQVGDKRGQREVLLQVLSFLERTKKPGEVMFLPFRWPEDPKKTAWQPPEMSPLIRFYLEEIKQARQKESEKEKGK
jgi:hypothetical protein